MTTKAPTTDFRGSITRLQHSLSTLRRRTSPTQDSLPAAGQALPDGIGYPLGSNERFPICFLTSLPPFSSLVAQRVFFVVFLPSSLPSQRTGALWAARTVISVDMSNPPNYGSIQINGHNISNTASFALFQEHHGPTIRQKHRVPHSRIL